MAEDISQLLSMRCTLIKKRSRNIIEVSINSIFQKYGIKRDACHGDNLNGAHVRRLMADSDDITHELFILLKDFSRGYITNENFEQVSRTHAKLLRHIEGDLY